MIVRNWYESSSHPPVFSAGTKSLASSGLGYSYNEGSHFSLNCIQLSIQLSIRSRPNPVKVSGLLHDIMLHLLRISRMAVTSSTAIIRPPLTCHRYGESCGCHFHRVIPKSHALPYEKSAAAVYAFNFPAASGFILFLASPVANVWTAQRVRER